MMDSRAVPPGRIEGYAIVSEDGMLADATGVMPDSLKFDADQKFFERGLDGLDVVVHGRHSRERHLRSQLRRRLVVTRRVCAIAADPSEENSLFWNPAGASFEEALTSLGMPNANVGVIAGVRLPGGRPVFPEVPARTPEEVLAVYGLEPRRRQILDAAKGLAVVSWLRTSRQKKSAQPCPSVALCLSSKPAIEDRKISRGCYCGQDEQDP